MADISHSDPSANASPGSRITSLQTLRALQKAAKQFITAKANEKDSNNENPINEKPEILIQKGRDKSPPSSTKKNKILKSPEDLNIYELKKSFQTALSKLYTSETKDLAVNDLKLIIMNNISPQSLRIYLSSLTEYKKVANPNTQEVEVFLLGFIATQYKENLIDPLDKVPSLLKTCFRVIETVQAYFKVVICTIDNNHPRYQPQMWLRRVLIRFNRCT